jgi:hypothetical protein
LMEIYSVSPEIQKDMVFVQSCVILLILRVG